MSIGTINDKLVIGDITEVGRFGNHSVEPNCEYRVIGGSVHMFTIRDIAEGEELVIDYNRNKEFSVNMELGID
jgi:SET domain-containing protein